MNIQIAFVVIGLALLVASNFILVGLIENRLLAAVVSVLYNWIVFLLGALVGAGLKENKRG